MNGEARPRSVWRLYVGSIAVLLGLPSTIFCAWIVLTAIPIANGTAKGGDPYGEGLVAEYFYLGDRCGALHCGWSRSYLDRSS
jgi:hypothetical protein